MERLGAPESQTLMVGDGKNDILVAKAVGCGSCLVARSGEMEQNLVVYEPDIIIHSMEELPELFEET